MKIIILKKNNLVKFLSIIILLLIFIVVIYFFTTNNKTTQTIYPLDTSKNVLYDLNADGNKDSIEILNSENKSDIKIKSTTKEYLLSNEISDKILFTNSNTLKLNIFIHDDHRTNLPKIILMGFKNTAPVNYIFQWDKNSQKFSLIFSDTKNTLGILDCKNTKTPQYFSLDSIGGINSSKSFMIINNSNLNIVSDLALPYDTIENFINLIQLPYELDELPNIFAQSISRDELSVLWSLNKENNSYKFQNAFFYDYDWNDNNDPTSIKYRISFKQESISKSYNPKELVFLIDLIKTDRRYKITSIQKCN